MIKGQNEILAHVEIHLFYEFVITCINYFGPLGSSSIFPSFCIFCCWQKTFEFTMRTSCLVLFLSLEPMSHMFTHASQRVQPRVKSSITAKKHNKGKDSMNYRLDETLDSAIMCLIPFASKSLFSAEWHYSNIECKALIILHGLEKCHHHCFISTVCVITDHKPFMEILSKDVATLSQWLENIMLRICQYGRHIIYRPGQELYITDWLSHNNHTKTKTRKFQEWP